jgi:hypothetical protein
VIKQPESCFGQSIGVSVFEGDFLFTIGNSEMSGDYGEYYLLGYEVATFPACSMLVLFFGTEREAICSSETPVLPPAFTLFSCSA